MMLKISVKKIINANNTNTLLHLLIKQLHVGHYTVTICTDISMVWCSVCVVSLLKQELQHKDMHGTVKTKSHEW